MSHTIDSNTLSKAMEIGNVLTVHQSGCPYSHQGYHWPLQSTLCAILDVPFPKENSMQALLPCFSALLEKVYHDLMDVSYLEIQPKLKQYTIALITNPFVTTITPELWRLQTKQVEGTHLPQCKITAAPFLCGLKVWLTLRCQLRAPYSPRIQFPICMTCIPANMNNFIPHL